ncbi:MAG TPA: NAD-dependent epimerase/dehydratase family protein [Thermoanaerobaculia bacterium]|nr:NAD-dependent epimerase/dehydratase family protein [Thermoanaerobaculia bacterium]
MKAILFGATGMIGQGVLRECLLDPEVESVVAVGRRETVTRHEKLREIVHRDFFDFSSIEGELSGFDACFFCLGVSSAGMSEAEYRRVTYDITMAAARVLAKQNPGMTLLYISGAGTDSTERGRTMWARVKGATENALLRLPFKAAYMIRPAYIQPLDGIVSSTKWTRVLYAVMGPLYPLWKTLFPKYVTTTRELARAMIQVAKHGASNPILESADFAEVLRAG